MDNKGSINDLIGFVKKFANEVDLKFIEELDREGEDEILFGGLVNITQEHKAPVPQSVYEIFEKWGNYFKENGFQTDDNFWEDLKPLIISEK